MDTDNKANNCGFDLLFSKNVPHIFEKIFFNLDYDSFTACRKVSKAWSELLSSKSFRKKEQDLLFEKMAKELRQEMVRII